MEATPTAEAVAAMATTTLTTTTAEVTPAMVTRRRQETGAQAALPLAAPTNKDLKLLVLPTRQATEAAVCAEAIVEAIAEATEAEVCAEAVVVWINHTATTTKVEMTSNVEATTTLTANPSPNINLRKINFNLPLFS